MYFSWGVAAYLEVLVRVRLVVDHRATRIGSVGVRYRGWALGGMV